MMEVSTFLWSLIIPTVYQYVKSGNFKFNFNDSVKLFGLCTAVIAIAASIYSTVHLGEVI